MISLIILTNVIQSCTYTLDIDKNFEQVMLSWPTEPGSRKYFPPFLRSQKSQLYFLVEFTYKFVSFAMVTPVKHDHGIQEHICPSYPYSLYKR